MLMELGYQFDFIDSDSEFERYELLLLPDVIPVNERFAQKLSAYLKKGGKLISTFESGLDPEKERFLIGEMAVIYHGKAPYSPDFIVPKDHLAEELAKGEHVMYDCGTLVEAGANATFVQMATRPVFNRTYEHFCSHLHSPSGREEVYPAVVETENTAYFIHPVFSTYQKSAPRWYKILLGNELKRLLPRPLVRHNGPTAVTVNLLEQENRRILHILYYVPERKCKNLDIVEDVVPLYNLEIKMHCTREVKKVYLVPSQEEIMYRREEDNIIFTVPKVEGHQMCAIEFI